MSACYRGDRFYDAPSAQAVVTKWATICRCPTRSLRSTFADPYVPVAPADKTYRDILTTDVIHIRRPDGQGLDAFMHAGPQLPIHKGFALVFNPTLANITAPMTFPLYYTGKPYRFAGCRIAMTRPTRPFPFAGLTTIAAFSREGAPPVNYTLARDYSVSFSITVPAQTVTWFAIAASDSSTSY